MMAHREARVEQLGSLVVMGSDGAWRQSWVSPHFFRQHKLEKNAALTPTPAVTDRILLAPVFFCMGGFFKRD